ncbi:MAG TPA: DNA gyrase C-terminal beta-propeller domain-containing protein, partial [Spirochaetia bacterium]|nr:DNA gyrase C-terminal beta-propeller domain-containing protein [Spirochaetia bacterium]
LLSLGSEEDITAVVSLRNFEDERFVLMATRQGVVKKVPISDFANARTRGIVAIKLDQGDHLVTALLTTGKDEVVLVTRKGNALRFNEDAVRAMGRASHGVRGIRLSNKDELAGVAMVTSGEQMLLVSEFGFGKRTEYDNFSPHGRGTGGQICYRATEKTGEVIGVLSVSDKDDLVCITSQGNTVKLRLSEIATLGKTAMGVRIVNITKPDVVVGVARVVKDDQPAEGQPDGQSSIGDGTGQPEEPEDSIDASEDESSDDEDASVEPGDEEEDSEE